MSSIKRILIAAGGTGGHLYPAQGLAEQLKGQSSSCEILFVAGGLSASRYFNRDRFSYKEIATNSLASMHPIKLLKGSIQLFQGIMQSIVILKNFKPNVVVGFGSYLAVPPILAAKWLNIPIILHEANSVPGRANKWLAPLATVVGAQFPSALSLFKKKSMEVDLPLRDGYRKESVKKNEALAYFNLSEHMNTLLVCGGSQGAKAINKLIPECFSMIKQLSLQVIHLTGDISTADRLRELYYLNKIPACVKAFESQMQMAWGAATLFVGRSGASTIVEALEFEVPGILIPYPYAKDNHQEKNADFLVNEIKSAWKLLESELTSKKFNETLLSLCENDQFLIFKKALKAYKKRPQQISLCQVVLNLIAKE